MNQHKLGTSVHTKNLPITEQCVIEFGVETFSSQNIIH